MATEFLKQLEFAQARGVAATLAEFAAALVMPESHYVIDLASLNTCPDEAKKAAAGLFDLCMAQGLSLEEMRAIQAHIDPYLGLSQQPDTLQ